MDENNNDIENKEKIIDKIDKIKGSKYYNIIIIVLLLASITACYYTLYVVGDYQTKCNTYWEGQIKDKCACNSYINYNTTFKPISSNSNSIFNIYINKKIIEEIKKSWTNKTEYSYCLDGYAGYNNITITNINNLQLGNNITVDPKCDKQIGSLHSHTIAGCEPSIADIVYFNQRYYEGQVVNLIICNEGITIKSYIKGYNNELIIT